MINPQLSFAKGSSAAKKVTYQVTDTNEYGYLVMQPVIAAPEKIFELMVYEYVSLSVGFETGIVYGLGGLTIKQLWDTQPLIVPEHERGTLAVTMDSLNVQAGVGYDTPLCSFPERYDPEQKILKMGLDGVPDYSIMIFENLIIAIKNNALHSIYVLDI